MIDFNVRGLEFYTKNVGARERVESGDSKWLNMIMDKAAMKTFVAT